MWFQKEKLGRRGGIIISALSPFFVIIRDLNLEFLKDMPPFI